MCESSRSHLEKHSAGNKTVVLQLNCLHVIAEPYPPKPDLGLTQQLLAGCFPLLQVQGFPLLPTYEVPSSVLVFPDSPFCKSFLLVQKSLREKALSAPVSMQDKPLLLRTVQEQPWVEVPGKSLLCHCHLHISLLQPCLAHVSVLWDSAQHLCSLSQPGGQAL